MDLNQTVIAVLLGGFFLIALIRAIKAREPEPTAAAQLEGDTLWT